MPSYDTRLTIVITNLSELGRIVDLHFRPITPFIPTTYVWNVFIKSCDNETVAVRLRKIASVSTSIDPENVRVFLRLHDQCLMEVTTLARQITLYELSTDPVRLVNQSFCVDPEYIESSIALGFIEGVSTEKHLTDEILPSHLKNMAIESI